MRILEDITLDECVRFAGFDAIRDGMPPTLYVDSYTVLREVSDVRNLRPGDHCLVGLNIFHKLWSWADMCNALLTSWEAQPLSLFHHFIIIDQGVSLDESGRPIRNDGQPVRIAEFSDTFANAWARLVKDGHWPRALLRNALAILRSPAKLHTPPLADYLGLRGRGVFVVLERRSEAQRRRTVDAALALASGDPGAQPTYGVLSANCEHLANQLGENAFGPVSPQVPHNLWNLFRLCLQLVGLTALYVCAIAPPDCWRTHGVAALSYHLLSTLPVAAQAQTGLVRTAVNLTQRRAAGDLDEQSFGFLMIKEGSRNVVVMILAVGGLSLLPRLVWEHGRLGLACVLSLTGMQLANLVFNVVANAIYRTLLVSGVGVPVARFDDRRLAGRLDHGLDKSHGTGNDQYAETRAAPSRVSSLDLSRQQLQPRASRSPPRRRSGHGSGKKQG